MGQLNNELNDFLKNNQEFADIVNLSVYKGNQVLRPENLEDVGQVIYPQDHRGAKHELRNDVSKRCRNGHTYQIYCLENETKVSYVMPVRGMLYEAGRYMEQVKEIHAGHEKTDYQDWGEYSSGFTREDRVQPVITLVLYWSREPWDGAGSLLDMLDISEEEKKDLSPFLNDYKVNLINMYDLEGLENCRGQLKYVLKLLKLDQDKKAIYEEVAANPEYRKLNLQTGRVLAVFLGSEKIRKYVEKNKEKGAFDMCKALDDLWKDAEQEGMERGIERGLQQGAIRVNLLNQRLIHEKRYQALERSASDAEYQQKLFAEYGL